MKLERIKRQNGKEYRYRMSPEAAQREDEAKRRWHRENYERLAVDVPKGLIEDLTQLARRRGMSRRQLVISVLQREIDKKSAD